MKKCALFVFLSLAVFLICESVAVAAQKTAVVLPFSVQAPENLQYLGKAIPTTVQNQLDQQGVLKATVGTRQANSSSEARRAIGNADYAIWGKVDVQGGRANITLSSVDKAGKTWSKSQQVPLNAMTGAISQLTQSMTRDGMHLSPGAVHAADMSGGAMRTPGSSAKNVVRQGRGSSSDIIMNETGQQYYLNPQFRYQGASAGDASRIRSQRLKISMSDMAVGDFNGDGKNEIAIMDAHHIYMYVWGNDGRLKELGNILISQGQHNFLMRPIDLNRDGSKELVVATYDESQNRPYTYFYSFKNNRFSQFCDRCAYFCSVVRMPPTYTPTLIGQSWDSLKLFRPGIYNMVKSGKTFVPSTRLNLPKDANVFNFCWLPNSRGGDGEKIVVLREDERLRLYASRNVQSPIHTTMEQFSGSAVGMDHYKAMPGMGVDRNYQMPGKYYAPMRFLTEDIGRTGEYVLIINKPISTASQFFDRYRYFPQGEIHALYWDGVGLGLKWKTRRIRGSVGQIDLADMNNDGVLDLVVGINSSPELGIGSRQCMVVGYPLNANATNPNAPVDMSDFEVNPSR